MIAKGTKRRLARLWRRKFPNGPHDHGCIIQRTFELADTVVSDLAAAVERSGSAVRFGLQVYGKLGAPGMCWLEVLSGERHILVPVDISPRAVYVAHDRIAVGYDLGAEFLMAVILNLISELTGPREADGDVVQCH